MCQRQANESPAIQATHYRRGTRAFSRMVPAVVLAAVACVSLSAQSILGAKMYMVQGQKLQLVGISDFGLFFETWGVPKSQQRGTRSPTCRHGCRPTSRQPSRSAVHAI